MKCSSTKLAITESAQHLTFQLNYLKRLLQCIFILFAFNSSLAQNVGIGTLIPTEKLEVAGNIKGNNFFVTGYVGIGTLNPIYKLQVYDGSLAITNSTDDITWTANYNSTGNFFNIAYNGTSRMALTNAGNLGVGNTAPAYKLDVNGNIHAETNAIIDGNVTVNSGKGILQNSHGAGQLKYYTRTAAFSTGNLGGFDLSAEGTIGFSSGVFSSPPKVFVGNIVSTGGTLGELYRVQLILYDVTTTSCKARLLNTSPNTVNYSITWNIVCIGE